MIRDLKIAQWLYRQEGTVSEILSKSFTEFNEFEQKVFVTDVIHDRVTLDFPTSVHFRRRLLREAIRGVEDRGQPLTDELVSEYTTLLMPTPHQPDEENQWSYKTFTFGDVETGQEEGYIRVRCSRDLLKGGTGCKEWEAGILLGEYILNHQLMFKDRVVMELGCGVGFTGVCLMRQNPSRLILTDGNKEALVNCQRNLSMNEVSVSKNISLMQLTWNEECNEHPEIVIGSDLLYDTNVIPSLVRLLEELLSKKTGQLTHLELNCDVHEIPIPFCLLMSAIRNENTIHAFLEAIKGTSLKIADISHHLSNLKTQFFKLICRRCNIAFYLIH